jgi:pimeloyl-ACP methyl ester carboxylesterase
MSLAGLWLLVLVAAIGAALVYQAAGTRRDAAAIPPPGQLVDIGAGRRLHLYSAGAGHPTVVFDAGIAASSLSWTRVQPRVAEFTRACSYDRGGLAWSDSTGPITASRLADQLMTLLTTAAVPPPYVLVGHSFGSFVVRLAASRYPDRVAGLVLVDPIYPAEWLEMSPRDRQRLRGGVFFSRVGVPLAQVGFVRACLNLLMRGSTSVPRGAARMFGSEATRVLTRLVNEVQKLPEEARPAVRAHWSQPKSFAAMARHLGCLQASAAEVAGVEAPTSIPIVVLTAPSQPEVARREQARIAGLSSRGRQIIAATGGHWVHLDEPELVVSAVREVVESVRADGTLRI